MYRYVYAMTAPKALPNKNVTSEQNLIQLSDIFLLNAQLRLFPTNIGRF